MHADEHDASNVRGRSGRRPRRVRALVAGIVALVVVSSIALRAIAFPAPALASSSTLAVLGGEVALAIGAAEFVEATDGELVQPGDRVRTGTDGYALLTYFDGSTVELEPRTEIAVDALRATTAGDIMVAMTLGAGRTWHVIARRLTDRSQYEVTTDSLSASVRGTAFEVRRDPDGRSVVATSEGVVATTAAGQTVEVAEGQSTEVPAPGAPPSAPAPIAEPDITVTVSVGATQNALVTDGKGRTVGVRNGQPILYVPGSRVAIVDGRLVITIPGVESGRLTTLVRPSPGEDGITLRTEVRRRGVGVVGSTEETRSVDADGNARGGVVVTATGVDILPESDARSANPPKIGRRPRPPAPDFPIPFSAPPPPEPSEIVPPASPTGAFPTASSRRATGTPGSVPSRAPTATPALGQTSSPTSSSTSGPTSTATRGATATPSSASSPSATSTPEPTSTPTATATPTATPTPTATATPTPTVTATANRTATAVPTATATASPSATATPH